MVHVAEVRRRCQIEARRFHFSEQLFNRIPMYFFRYFKSINPLLDNSEHFSQIHIITVFMIINNIEAILMMAFYNAGEQDFETQMKLHSIFATMWRLYRTTNAVDRISVFGRYFSFHLQTRTLRRIDMSVVTTGRDNHEPFVPHQTNWIRWREVRRLILSREFRINDDYDLFEVREAMQGGILYQRGRNRR